jgi:hypothetical protein
LNEKRIKQLERIKVPSFHELNFSCGCEDFSIYKALIDIFPNIESLAVSDQEFPAKTVFELDPKLKKLETLGLGIDVFSDVKSNNLKELKLLFFYPHVSSHDLWKLAENMPNLEKLYIDDVCYNRLDQTIDKDIKTIMNSLKFFKNLKEFELLSETFTTIKANSDADNVHQKGSLMSSEFKLTILTKD